MSMVFSGIALMLISLMIIRQPVLLMSAVFFLALFFGGLFSIFPSAVVNLFGEANFGLNYGIVFTGLGAAGLFPYLGGILFEIQDHYLSTYGLLLVTTLLALLFSLKVKGISQK